MKMYMTFVIFVVGCILVQGVPLPEKTMQERAQEAFDRMKEKAQEAMDYVQDAANRAIESAKVAVQEAMGTAQEVSKQELEKGQELLDYGKNLATNIGTTPSSPLQ